ncbi:MAG: hypothetical protein J4F50_05850 [Acidimicrobiia bacterium]|nr:hypothetical protein [Acidimicrobiia bacterium]
MTQTATTRPRLAAIGLKEPQIESVAPLCGSLRTHSTLSSYLMNYNWTETDITILRNPGLQPTSPVRGLVLAIGSSSFTWIGHHPTRRHDERRLSTHTNTERELEVPADCPDGYRHLASELAKRMSRAADPPFTFSFAGTVQEDDLLVKTTSGRAVARRYVFPHAQGSPTDRVALALALPEEVTLPAWLRAFLADIHEVDPTNVPRLHPAWRILQTGTPLRRHG